MNDSSALSANSNIHKVHVVFKTHLDIGFTNYAAVVTQQYMDHYIPGAIKLAREIRQEGGADQFTWTVGSWLIYEYLEHASGAPLKEFEEAIAEGDILWHGLPFTTHSELMDRSLFEFGISLSQALDRRFGKHTIAAKMTDVPGHTRGIVPLLARAGIEFLHIGVNPVSAVPLVPELFVWRDEASDSQITVMYNAEYGTPTSVEQIGEALCVASTLDNVGPHSADAVNSEFAQYRSMYPAASVVASDLNQFALALRNVRGLPVVTSEIGDSWIHGVGSDPLRVAQFRELMRLRNQWLVQNRANVADLSQFSRKLMMVAEHTWGMDEKAHLGDFSRYDTVSLAKARSEDKFKAFEDSWKEQRLYIPESIAVLPSEDLISEAKTAVEQLQPVLADRSPKSISSELQLKLITPRFAIEIDADTGAVVRLYDSKTGKEWASIHHPIALLSYQVFGSLDYDRYFNQYFRDWALGGDINWGVLDFGKTGLEEVLTMGKRFSPMLRGIDHSSSDEIVLEIEFPLEATQQYGAPGRIYVALKDSSNFHGLDITVSWFNKQACRIPEAIWLSMVPVVSDYGRWRFDKIASEITSNDVVSKGNRRLHAVHELVKYEHKEQHFNLRTLDTPLVSIGEATLLDFNDEIAMATEGVHFNLYNNVWGTNFAMWFEDDMKYRFKIEL